MRSFADVFNRRDNHMSDHKPCGPYERFIKRPLDCLLAICALIVLSPTIGVTALLVRIKLGTPVFFTQERPGKDEKIFKLYKFRSMTDRRDEEENLLPDDERLTKFGRMLRSTSLDELPQLFNIIRGDMSVVGPRPERPELTEEYKKEMPEFGFRLKVKAGLTGYAQVTGAYDTTPYDKLKMDLMYIENYSIRLDLQIILMTLKTMFFPPKNNAEIDESVLAPKIADEKKENSR